MKIVIIGSGNVATHLAVALRNSDQEIVQVYSRNSEHAIMLADKVGAKAISELQMVVKSADLCLIAVKDDAIEEVASELIGFEGILAHTSGAVSLDVFIGRFERYGVFYPLQTFSKSKEISFANVPICLEANSNETLSLLAALAQSLTSRVAAISSENRMILHLAAVFACNFTNHLYALGAQILERYDLDFDLLRPLINETAIKVQHALPSEVQTGPAIRNDEETEKKHLDLLENQPQLKEIYKTLSTSIKKTR